MVETMVVSLEVLMVTTGFPTCISLSFGHCPLRKTIRRWKRLKNQIEPIKGSLAQGSCMGKMTSKHIWLKASRACIWESQRTVLTKPHTLQDPENRQ